MMPELLARAFVVFGPPRPQCRADPGLYRRWGSESSLRCSAWRAPVTGKWCCRALKRRS